MRKPHSIKPIWKAIPHKTRAVVGQRSWPAGYILYCNIFIIKKFKMFSFSFAFAFAFAFPSHCVKVFQMLISQQSLLTEASNLELRYHGGSSEIPRE